VQLATRAPLGQNPLQLDKATADAAEFKAGFDKMVVDSVEQKAQVRGSFV
jgi:hypothetical protein